MEESMIYRLSWGKASFLRMVLLLLVGWARFRRRVFTTDTYRLFADDVALLSVYITVASKARGRARMPWWAALGLFTYWRAVVLSDDLWNHFQWSPAIKHWVSPGVCDVIGRALLKRGIVWPKRPTEAAEIGYHGIGKHSKVPHERGLLWCLVILAEEERGHTWTAQRAVWSARYYAARTADQNQKKRILWEIEGFCTRNPSS